MNRKIFALAAFLAIFVVLHSGLVLAVDVSIDSVKANGRALAEDKTNFLQDTDNLDIVTGITAIKNLSRIHVEAVLTDSGTGNTIADSSGNFILNADQNTLIALNLRLIDKLKREKDFRLQINVVDINGNKESKTFGIRFTGGRIGAGSLDVSIDKVLVNGAVVASSQANFIDQSSSFNVEVDFTALEDLKNAHVEAVLRDMESGNVVADSTNNFNLAADSISSKSLTLNLLGKLKQSNSFELAIRIADAEGHSLRQTYGITMRGRNIVSISGAAEGLGRALDISIDSAELEDNVLAENENNFVNPNNLRDKLRLRVRITSLENIQDAHMDAVLAFENGVVVADATNTFDLTKGNNVLKSLEIPLTGKFQQDNFRLKIRVVDAEGGVQEKNYGLIVNQNKLPFVINSISLSPENNIQAGKSLEAKVNFRNNGVIPLGLINLKVSIPELDISSTRFIDHLKSSNPEISEEFLLPVSEDVQAGTYTVRAEIFSQFNGQSEAKEIPIHVAAKPEQDGQLTDRLVINAPAAEQDLNNDGTEAIFPLILKNEGSKAHSYTLSFEGASWANLRLSDSSAFVISPGETKTINVYVSAKENAQDEQPFTAVIKGGKVFAQIPLKANIIEVSSYSFQSYKVFGIFLIAVFVLLAVGLFFAIRHLQGGRAKEKETEKNYTETYY